MRPFACLSLAVFLAFAGGAVAGSFGVAPTRLDFDPRTRSAVVEVASDDDSKLSFQAKLFEWTQGPDGKDQYTESQDLIWFPQIFSVDPRQKRIIRVGTKPRAETPAREKTYRLFIEEVLPPAAASSGAEVKVVLRFGLPVFVAPGVDKRSFVIDSVEPEKGKVRVRVGSDGTRSARFETVRIKHGDTVVAEGPGWYVLAGSARTFEVAVDPAKCPLAGPLEVVVEAEGVVLRKAFTAPPGLCERP